MLTKLFLLPATETGSGTMYKVRQHAPVFN